ncbi:MAG: PD40 domain-containing protein [Bacteroidales bacterium]|nr:PD40 domain-containing protein [Bacteroidales bacterium]
MKRFVLSCLLFLIVLNFSYSQVINDAFREVFTDAEYFLVEESYYDALLEYDQLYKNGFKDNANINYRMGICYLNIPGKKDKAIPFLEKAIQNVSASYIEGSLKEVHAPLDALLYLGNAYRVNNQLEKACVAYKKYIEQDSKNIENVEYSKKQIEACSNAKELIQTSLILISQNLGAPVNTNANNFKAVVSADESRIVYVTEQKFYDAIMQSDKKDGKWDEPVNLTPQVQSDGDQYPCYLSPDGNILLLSKEDFFNSDIYISTYSNGEWKKSTSVGKVINTKYWESHACLSPDGNTMYFASNRKGGIGGMDIYYSVKGANGEWTEPVNIGSPINTELNEDTPFILGDGKTLYFSSQGHKNMGGFDIFYTKKNDDGTWTEPENIGYPINTTDDDLFLQPLGEGNVVYKTQFLKDGLGEDDIYRIEITGRQEKPMVPEVVETDQPVVEEVVEVPEDIKTPVKDISVVEQPVEEEIAIEKPGERIVLKPIYFDYDKYSLDKTSLTKLENVIKVMKEYSDIKLMVIGHTDSKGSFEYNKTLSEKRAKATVDYLKSKGISAGRMEVKGQSESEPTAINTNSDGTDCPEGRRLNRRVEFKMIQGQYENIIIEKEQVPDNLKIK